MSSQAAPAVRDLRLLLLAMFLNSVPLGYDLVVLPIYLNELGFTGEIIGAITSVSSIASTIAFVPFAIAADRYGRKHFVIWGLISSALAFFIFATTRDLTSLFIASAVGGVGLAGGFTSAVWVPAWNALLTEKASAQARTRAFAWSQGIWTLALTGGAAISVVPSILRNSFNATFLASFQTTFLVMVALSVLSGVILFPLKETIAKRKNSDTSLRRLFPHESAKQIIRFSVTFGLVGFASGFAVQLLSLWFNKMYGVNEFQLGPWFSAAEITSLVVVPIIPRLTRRFGSVGSVLTTQAGSAALLGAMTLAPTYQVAGMIFIARNFLMNIAWPIQQSYLMGTVAPHERASASAITFMVWGVGSSVSPVMAGYLLGLSTYASLSATIIIGAVVYLASALAFFLLFKHTPPPEETSA